MSQSGVLSFVTGGGPVVETLTGNTGGPVGPSGSFNINLVGNNSSGINIVGNPGTNTLTVTAFQATTSQEGTVTLATDAQAIAGTDTANALTSSNLAAKLGTQTAHSLAVFEGSTSALTALGAATNGQLPIGSTGADPVLGNITSSGGTITITNGAGTINLDVASSAHVVETLTGNSGGAISPTAGNINTLGTGSITIAGSGSTLTTQLTGLTAHNVLIGAGTATITNVAPSATSGVPLISQGAAADPAFGTAVVAGGGTGQTTLTNHGVLVGAATAAITQLAVGSNGQVLIGATAADPAFATLTSSDSSISFTTGINTLSLQVAGGSTTIKTITGNTGGAESPSAGNFNIVGTGSITVAGTANTETVQLTGLTNHAIQIGAGTATLTQLGAGTTGQVLQTNTTADPTWSTATYPSTATGTGTILRADGTNWVPTTSTYPNTNAVSTLLYASSANVMSALATTNRASLSTNSTGVPTWLALTDGQVVIGSTAGSPAAATISAGTGITITNASNSITIAVTGAGFTWSDTSGTVTASAQNGYFITTTCTSTLPASPSEGDTVKYIVDTTNLLTITGNTGQKIRIGTTLSAAAGTCVNTQRGDAITLVYRTTGTTWFAEGNPVGGWNIT